MPVTRSRIVVTGMGAISPFGRGIGALWRGLEAGECAIRELDVFDPRSHRTHLAGQATPPPGERGKPSAVARLTRSERFALAAAREAWSDAGLDVAGNRARVGVFFGSSTGGMLEGETYFTRRALQGRRSARASRLAAQPTSGPAAAIARELSIRGPVETNASACSAATMAIEAALNALRTSEIEIAIAGGADSLCQLTYGGFNSLRAVDTEPARPFRADRAGMSLGEGAGVLILEIEDDAAQRGIRPRVELAGAASTCDAFHMTAPDPEAQGAARAMLAALADAGATSEDVAFVDAHGTGTPHNDAAEWRALQRVFGERAGSIPVTAIKGSIGHLLGACGALEAIATVLGLLERRVHPTPGEGAIDPAAAVDLVLGAPRPIPHARAALSLNLAFGGANAALVFRLLDGRERGT
jgi:3-oxoacyl-[acyl-carrier-protein] synthase II